MSSAVAAPVPTPQTSHVRVVIDSAAVERATRADELAVLVQAAVTAAGYLDRDLRGLQAFCDHVVRSAQKERR